MYRVLRWHQHFCYYRRGADVMSIYNILLGASVGGGSAAPGSVTYSTPGTYCWVVPAGVTSVSVVAVGGGGGGASNIYSCCTCYAAGGGGGGLGYANNKTVTPGSSIRVVVGAGGTYASGTAGSGGARSYATTVAVGGGGHGGTSAGLGGSPGTHSGCGGGNGGYGGCGITASCIHGSGGGGGAGGYSGAGG